MSDDLVCDGRGWYKTYRQIDEWEWYKTPHMFHIFSHILNKANYEDKYWQGILVKRGQLITSLPHLSEETGISIQSVRTCLNHLKSTGEITDKSTNKYRLITIVKYNTYQCGEEVTNQQTNRQTNSQLTGNQQATNSNEEVKKERSNIYMSTNGHCPHSSIIELYHNTLPMLPRLRVLTDARKKHLSTRWKEDKERQSLEWWEGFFSYIAKSKFLTGKVTDRNGKAFLADLGWIIKPENFAKIIEGKYE